MSGRPGAVHLPAHWLPDLAADGGHLPAGCVPYRSLDGLLRSRAVAAGSAVCVEEPVGDELLRLVPAGCLLSFSGTGIWDLLDVDLAAARGVEVSNVTGYGTGAIAEHTFALILAAARALLRADRCVRAGRRPSGDWGGHLEGKVLGVVGLGAVGRRVALLGVAFGMRVLATARRPASTRWARAQPSVRVAAPAELFAASDVVTLHGRHHRGDRPIVGRAELASMRPTAILVNTARGGLLDLDALAEALGAGTIAAAGLDVFDPEPPPPGHPLLALDNVILSPHVAGAAAGIRLRALRGALDAARAFTGPVPASGTPR